NVQQHYFRLLSRDNLHHSGPIPGNEDAKAFVAENAAQGGPNPFLVIHHQNGRVHLAVFLLTITFQLYDLTLRCSPGAALSTLTLPSNATLQNSFGQSAPNPLVIDVPSLVWYRVPQITFSMEAACCLA